MSKKILITGANGGFGKLSVETLLSAGHEVAATMRGVEGKNKEAASALTAAGAVVIELDVTSEDSVNGGVSSAIDQLGGLDVVINNAGVGVLGIQEMFTTEDWQRLFDINVFGVQRVVRAALPHLRSQGSGLLVFVSSLLGRMTFPFYGPYNASKWALEAMAENYRVELSGFGVDAAIVEPGGFPTPFFNGLMRPSDDSQKDSYGEMIHAPKAAFESFEGALAQNPEQNPQMVADAILQLVDTPTGQRSFRTTVDKMGMGAHIEPYNQQLEQVMQGIYGAFGMGGMLTVKDS